MRNVALILACLFLAIAVVGLATAPASGQSHGYIPEDAWQYKRYAMSVWHDEFGLDAPTALLAGQVHQESLWDYDARSPYAHGLAQFTPGTAEDMCRWYPDLRPCDTGDPRWSLRAQSAYMSRLVGYYDDTFDPWLFALSAYNGGPGWVNRDRRVCQGNSFCDPDYWRANVEVYYDERRADWAIKENRHYVRIITSGHQYKYHEAGWGELLWPDPWSLR